VAGKAEILQGRGTWPSEKELLQGYAGLGVMAQWNGDCVCFYFQHGRPWGRGLAEIVNVCGFPALRACQAEIWGSEGGSLG
jgi:hypothetical protein